MIIVFALLTNFVIVRFVSALITITSGDLMYVLIYMLRKMFQMVLAVILERNFAA
jgi:hypothetical protein